MRGMLINLGVTWLFYTNELNSLFINWRRRYSIYLTGHTEFNGFHDPVNCHLAREFLNLSPFN